MTSPAVIADACAMRRDLAHAVRALARDRSFTLICVLSLGIGMGAFIGFATFARGLMAPARGIDTNGLVEVLVLPRGPLRARAGYWALQDWSYPDYQALRGADSGMAVTGWTLTSSEIGEPASDDEALPRVATMYVSANYFDVFGVSLARGPGFDSATDDSPSPEPRVVLSHGFWQARAGADPDIIGKSVTIDGVPHVVVGVGPDDFYGHFHYFDAPSSLVFLPLERHPRLRANPDLRHDRAVDWVRIHGRLDPGTDIAQANAAASAIMAGLAQEFPATNEFKSATVEAYYSQDAVDWPTARLAVGGILALAGAVLLLVCLNISGMMLVRGKRRERELGIRAALGASRRRQIQYLFLEAVLLACIGGGLTVAVIFGVPAIAAWYFGAPVPAEFDFDAASIAISLGLCLAVSVVSGLLPALRFSRANLSPLLKQDAYGGGPGVIRLHRVAAMIQIGIAIPFFVVSGAMFDRVRTADLGFSTDGLAAARLPAPDEADTGPAGRDARSFVPHVRDSLLGTDAVRAVAVADGMPVDFDSRISPVALTGGAEVVRAQVTRVSDAFLETIGTPLVRGRPIAAEDWTAGARVAVISAPLAARLFPDSEAIGERVTVTLEENREETFTVVGVSADFATSQLTTERPQILLPLPERLTSPVYLIVRGAPGEELGLTAALENVVRELDVEAASGLPGTFRGIVTGADLERKSLSDLMFESTAVAVAGGVVLVLAVLGIVGVVGFMVAARQHEFAIRMALGATRSRVFGLMLSGVVKLVLPGVAAGILLGAVLINTLENVMGTPLTVGPTPLGVMEPVIYGAASAIAMAVALLAGLPAARRATSIQPNVALRAE
jgi:predicted permease